MKRKRHQFMEETLGRFHTRWILLPQCDAWIILCTAFQIKVEFFHIYLTMSLIEMLLIPSCVLIQPAKPPYMLLNDRKLDCISHFKHDIYWHWRICIAFTNSIPQSLQSSLSPTTITPSRAVLMKCHSLKARNKVKYPRWNCPDSLEGEEKKTPSKFSVKCFITSDST